MNEIKVKIVLLAILLFNASILCSQNFSYLKSSTAIANGITSGSLWTDLVSTQIDVTEINFVLLTASINMRADGSNSNIREVHYNIYNSADLVESGTIKREIVKDNEPTVERWGIGSVVHIFDVSSHTGNMTFTLEHYNEYSSGTGRDVYSSARLNAVALTTTPEFGSNPSFDLSNDIKRITAGESTTSSTFNPVTGLTTNAISLPFEGNIYVAASINSTADASGTIGEYKIQYSADSGTNWSDIGLPVKRYINSSTDDGIVNLVGLAQNLIAGNYLFRIAHSRFSGTGTLTTFNSNLVAVALVHNGGSFFPSIYSEVGSTGISITGVTTPAVEVTNSSFLTESSIGSNDPAIFLHSQYLVNATGLKESNPNIQKMRSANQPFLIGGNPTISDVEYFRYIENNSSFGSGGSIGLAVGLDENTNYTVRMMHDIEFVSNPNGDDEILTTSDVILTGFQTFDEPSPTLSVEDELLKQQLLVYSNKKGSIEIKSDKPLNAQIELFNILGQKLLDFDVKGIKEKSIKDISHRGIVIIRISTVNATYSKKLIL